MSESRINTELLARVRAHILEEPRRFRMERYVATPGYYDLPAEQSPPCGTVACIAGWAVAITDGLNSITGPDAYGKIEGRALELLGLEESSLFYHTCWPDEFCDRYENARTPQERAEVAADYINHIIETGKVLE
jgi:hypothetical protein